MTIHLVYQHNSPVLPSPSGSINVYTTWPMVSVLDYTICSSSRAYIKLLAINFSFLSKSNHPFRQVDLPSPLENNATSVGTHLYECCKAFDIPVWQTPIPRIAT